jgi:hypothetical protein
MVINLPEDISVLVSWIGEAKEHHTHEPANIFSVFAGYSVSVQRCDRR